MAVIFTETDEIETWLTAPWEQTEILQRPLAQQDRLRVTGEQNSAAFLVIQNLE